MKLAALSKRQPEFIMQRRDFLAASALATTAAALPLAAEAQAPGGERQYYEWRTFRAADPEHRQRIGMYIQAAALPAWKRLGLGPVGVFTETGDRSSSALHVLLVYPTLQAFAAERDALEQDAEHQKAAAEYVAAKKDDANFERIESSLLVAFTGMPMLMPPATRGCIFELRTYESYSEERGQKKIDMFNNGEMPLFVEAGFENVFFGETLIGDRLPNLKYMLAAPDMDANKAGWRKFMSLPGWVAMRDLPEYKDTVSKATPLFLEPTPYSQI
jgi:hypothetical protein